MFKILVIIITVYIAIDVLIYLLFIFLKQDFKWLINEDDENPKFKRKKFEHFLVKTLIK